MCKFKQYTSLFYTMPKPWQYLPCMNWIVQNEIHESNVKVQQTSICSNKKLLLFGVVHTDISLCMYIYSYLYIHVYLSDTITVPNGKIYLTNNCLRLRSVSKIYSDMNVNPEWICFSFSFFISSIQHESKKVIYLPNSSFSVNVNGDNTNDFHFCFKIY